jgi:hypothetical protein
LSSIKKKNIYPAKLANQGNQGYLTKLAILNAHKNLKLFFGSLTPKNLIT